MLNKVVLITGASSGIGKACAEYLISKNFCVYGTSRKAAGDSVKNNVGLQMLQMDVTDQSSVLTAVNTIIKNEGRIDILINNAGMGMAGSLEDSSYNEVKLQFDTNLFGALNVINEVLPHMRKAKSGLVVNIGSVAAYISIPYQAVYSATKAAMLSMTFSLRNEIKQFGLKACIVHPGDTKTSFTANRNYTEKSKSHTPYEERMTKSIETMEKDEKNGVDPLCVAKTVYRILKRKNPPASVTVGFKYKLVAFLFKVVPTRLREFIIGSIYA